MQDVRKEAAKKIRENIHLIREKRFDKMYSILAEWSEGDEYYGEIVGQISALLLDCGVDVLKYMNKVPYCYLFENSTLTDIVLPDNIKSIGDYAFSCSAIVNITIPDNVTTIGIAAFCECNGLKTIRLPSKLNTIEEDAFRYCSNLAAINYAGTTKDWNNINLKSNLFEDCEKLHVITCADGEIDI